MRWALKNLDKILFSATVLLVAFAVGVAVAEFKLFPYPMVRAATKSARDLYRNWPSYFGEEPTKFLQQARYEGNGVIRHDAQRADPGLTFMTGLFDLQPSAQIIDMEGTVVHRWVPDFDQIWYESGVDFSGQTLPFNTWDGEIHGAMALPNGSIVVNYSDTLVRLDKCSQPEWVLPYRTHHSVFLSEDGTFWFPSSEVVVTKEELPKGTRRPYTKEYALQVSASGEILQKIPLDDMLIDNGLEAVLLPTGTDLVSNTSPDFTHLNDIEVLQSADADSFPLFEAGDVMASYRNHNMIFVFDPVSRKVKWYEFGPWLRQHDPDFRPDGTIAVFNNCRDHTQDGAVFGGSSIMIHDPVTRETRLLYQQTPETPFYTDSQGKHERTPRGNQLVAETKAGRVFEVTEQGELVWEFINRFDADRVAQVTQADRLPADYFSVEDWSCN